MVLLSPSAILPRDIKDFIASYPSQLRTSPSQSPNYSFYTAPSSSKHGVMAMHQELRGDWDELEWRHNFVQWMFPIREQGMNPNATPLQVHEIGRMKQSEEIMRRLRVSYEIMLEFYGMRVLDPETGELDITLEPEKSDAGWPARFYNLEHRMHNYLRITRMLKCLHELSHPHYVPSFLLFVLALQHPSTSDDHSQPRLRSARLVRSMDGYWRHCIRDEVVREWVRSTIERVREDGHWGLGEYRKAVEGYRKTGRYGRDSGDGSVEQGNAMGTE
ncbi:opioid growth factor receptor [Dacryopinax primogenitus]|uniref:Opioid growth factor receptor n=1 Tax=Dacryopinax primogenitus (strain DJM 731) TaxID=1858805 RepID=M5FPI8_DACPD|nr:opioid growth factor receptor [Dacryopinax primogenitus]EJT97103.1 opioid growth factor receptor [Dacryopinax primogenitus]